MFALIVFLFCLFVAGGVGVMAGVSDWRGMTIPNIYSVVIFGLFVFCAGALWALGVEGVFAPLGSHVLGFVITFCITLALFFMKVWGAGDQKLISAFSIWFGFSGLMVFLIYTAFFGGLIGVAALILKKFKPVKNPTKGSWVEQVQGGASKVPYGIAIAAGALASFVKIGYFDLDTLRIFLES